MSSVKDATKDGPNYRLVTLPLHHLFPSSATTEPPTDTSPVSSVDQPETAQLEDSDKPQRALIACVACRTRKIKCSGDRPVCTTCAKTNQTCIYTPHAKRKRKSKVLSTPDDRSKKLYHQDISPAVVASQPSHIPHDALHPSQTYLSGIPAHESGIPPLGVPGPSTYTQTTQAQRPPQPIMAPTSEGSFEQSLSAQDPFDLSTFNPSADLEFINSLMSWQGVDTTGEEQGSHANIDWSLNDFLGWDPAISSTRNGENENRSKQSAMNNGVLAEQTGQSQSSKSRFRVPYFRFFGPTAIAPGYKQVQYDVSAPPSPKLSSQFLSGTSPLDNTHASAVLDHDEQYPNSEALQHLLPIFNLHYNYFFPFLRLPSDDISLLTTNKPPYLLNIMCALAARFSPIYGSRSASSQVDVASMSVNKSASHIWASKAKEQISKNISFSTVEMVETLVLISWYEFGQDRDAGLWMYSGMGLRMGQDLGLDSINKQISSQELPQAPDELYARQLHCSLVMMDAIMTIGTGRSGMYLTPQTILPTLPPITTSEGATQADPFLYLVKTLVLADSIARILRDHNGTPQPELLEKSQSDLNEFHTTLPIELRFETSAFQKYASLGHGSTFVLLHLWFHTLIILVYQPTLLRLGDNASSNDVSDIAGQQIAASSAKTILDIASFAELIDAKANTQPWINYPLYIAGCMFLSQCLSSSDDAHSAGQVHLAKIARANFQRIIGLLDTLQSYWAGVRYIRGALLQKAEGATQITLLEDTNEVPGSDVPPALAAMWSGQSDTNHLVGLSFTGTMNSPTDNFFSLVYPKASAGAASHIEAK
ncbi:hypothetical protein I302_105601 [Kwoniella bestiolae CBS 10118]|uniref:Zn(2)-C6 fungal-type domain-containing protein n=1 Tax=Kwoniella bestiolae CBS 10118 TaxID=1296100 RepID=A0A1B9G1M2_9TREE|nr:hypothetical protein I302_04720 [Kwoniella bestiolae CBS 10118]OCF24910.1 hypothetical protein I302_04720 [Kwoniella bestiolae CBS 10118]